MGIFRNFAYLASLFLLMALSACGTPPPPMDATASRADIAELTTGIMALGEGIDPEEAARAAKISYEYSLQLRREYQVTDSALVHNSKVNMGLRPRGLCYHWADDLEARLKQENFQTLQLHRAIANSTNIRIEHSTAIVSRRGDTMQQGIILDPWRFGGRLFWSEVPDDKKYIWIPRQDVFAAKRARAG